MMKNKIVLIFLLLNFISPLNSVEQKIKNNFLDIQNMKINKLLEADKDDSSLEEFEYQQDIYQKEKELKKKLNKVNYPELNGEWKLFDLKKECYFSDNDGFYIGRKIEFNNVNGFCNYTHQSSNSYIYKICNNKYVVFPSMDAGIIRLLFFEENKLYIYNLDGNFWILDKIHFEGAFYKKIEK